MATGPITNAAGRWAAGVAVVAVSILCLALGGCGQDGASANGDGRPVVVASIHPLADLARQVLGEDVDVHTLLPPGATPHGFELTADRLRTLARADLLLVVGRGLDPWAERAASRAGQDLTVLRMVDMVSAEDEATQAHDHDHDHHAHHDHTGPNPHVWLDPVRTAEFVARLGEAAADRYPAHADAIAQRTAQVLDSLDTLDAEYRAALGDVPVKQLVTFHNAFDLLAERYGLEVVAHLTPIELNPGAEVTPARLVAAVEAVKRYGLRTVYAEPQFPDAAVEALRRQANVQVLRLDPLGAPGRAGYGTYQDLMRSNLATLVRGQTRAASPTGAPTHD